MFLRFSLGRIFIACVLSCSTLWAAPVSIEEVIVTAQKRPQNRQDVPIAISALDANTLEQAAITNLDEVQFLLPSLTITTNYSPMETVVRLRGAGSGGTEPSIEPSVGMFIDGVYQSRAGLAITDLVDVERIEVLYGPQGTLYGKNTSAGVVSTTTRKPTNEFEGFLKYGVGSRGMQDVSASVSGPISKRWAYRFSGRYRKDDGWLDNEYLGTAGNNTDEYSLRGKLRFQATDNLDALLTVSHVQRQPDCCGSEISYGPDYLALAQEAGVTLGDNDSKNRVIDVNVDTHFELTSDAVSLHLDYDLGDSTLVSITAWDRYNTTRSGDEDRSLLDMVRVEDLQEATSISQELRLSSRFAENLATTVGLYYYYNDLQRGDGETPRVILGEDVSALWPVIRDRVPPFITPEQIGAPGEYSVLDNHWRQESIAAFGQLAWDIDEHWRLGGGLRYAYERKEAQFFIQTVTSTPFSLLRFELAPDTDQELDRTDGNLTGMFNLAYHWDNANLYASIASGYKAGGFNGTAGNFTPEEREYDPETSISYELGYKSLHWDNRLRLNMAAFYTIFNDFHALSFDGNAGALFLNNAGQQTSKGVEVTADLAVSQLITVGFDVAYLLAQYDEYEDGPCYYNSPDTRPDDSCDLSGQALPFAPKWAGNVYVLFHYPVAQGNVYVRADWYANSSQNIDTQLNPSMVESTRLFNLGAGFRTERWELSVWGKNLADQTDQLLVAEVPILADTNQYWLNPPRSYGAALRVNF